jgi:hypothetical protein
MSVQNIYLASPNGQVYINPDAIALVEIRPADPLSGDAPFTYALLSESATVLYSSVATFTTIALAFNAIAAIITSAIEANSNTPTAPVVINLS